MSETETLNTVDTPSDWTAPLALVQGSLEDANDLTLLPIKVTGEVEICLHNLSKELNSRPKDNRACQQ